jgi:hypothetical protein
LQIEQNGHRMHEHHTRQAITQMPAITSPHAPGTAAVNQLAEGGSNAIAQAPQHCAPTMSRCMVGRAKRSKRTAAPRAQSLVEARKPGGAFPQQPACGAFGAIKDSLALMHVGRSEGYPRNDPGSTQLHVDTKAIKGLASRMVFVMMSLSLEAFTAIGPSRPTDRHREPIHDGHTEVRAQQTVTDQTSDAYCVRPQIGRLPDKRRPVDALHVRKEVGPMPLEVQEEFLVLEQSQIRSHNVHRDDLAISYQWQEASLAQSLPVGAYLQPVVHDTKTCAKILVQVHSSPPQQVTKHAGERRHYELFLWQLRVAHRVS